jgi:hypothetical protein
LFNGNRTGEGCRRAGQIAEIALSVFWQFFLTDLAVSSVMSRLDLAFLRFF